MQETKPNILSCNQILETVRWKSIFGTNTIAAGNFAKNCFECGEKSFQIVLSNTFSTIIFFQLLQTLEKKLMLLFPVFC